MKYLAAVLILIVIGLTLYIIYHDTDRHNREVENYSEIKATLRGLTDSMTKIRKELSKITPDSTYTKRVEYISNYYKTNYYDKIANANDSEFNILLDSILSDNRATPFQRGN